MPHLVRWLYQISPITWRSAVSSQSKDKEDELETPALRPLVWLGNSLRNLRPFPPGRKKIIGDELQLIQFGGMPKEPSRSRASAAAF